METYYLIILGVLFILAFSDLIVGVSNDAVNFLNAAVGSKAGSFKLLVGIAGLGILIGCTFSSGMMEVARKGIFHPEHYLFSDLMLLFLAVMIADVILLDTFNTFGLPTSTTVSVVFELLGAAVAIALIKSFTGAGIEDIGAYINSGKALAIISGILLSVVVAFSTGAIVQYFVRMAHSFDPNRWKRIAPIWGGLCAAAISYFLVVKGAKGSSWMSKETVAFVNDHWA
ncbi:MAG: phosphate permease, partial [Bacteroidetes bacterium]